MINVPQSRYAADLEDKMTQPRLPRGVSRIPRQVGGQQQWQMPDTSRYLTFNKEQARSLRDELRVIASPPDSPACEPRGLPPSPQLNRPAQVPRPLERRSKQPGTPVRGPRGGQQPVCENFIMDGFFMLKLSRDVSENGQQPLDEGPRSAEQTDGLVLEQTEKCEPVAQPTESGDALATSREDRKPSFTGTSQADPLTGYATHLADSLEPLATGAKPEDSSMALPGCALTDSTSARPPPSPSAHVDYTYCKARVTPELRSCNTLSTARGNEGNSTHDALHLQHQHQQSDAPSIISTMRATPAAVGTSTKAGPIEKPLSLDALHRQDACNGFQHSKSVSAQSLERSLNLDGSGSIPNGNCLSKIDQSDVAELKINLSEPKTENKLTERQDQAECESARKQNGLLGQPLDRGDEPEVPPSPTLVSNDRDSARRLAKRLYNLSGFNRADICVQLVKCNPFSQLVADEYLDLFDFRSMKLDSALRKFLSKLELTGETQERERILAKFSRRYFECNKDKFPDADTVQTLVCALVLLNTDLHGFRGKRNKKPKLALGAFIDGLQSSLVDQRNELDIKADVKTAYSFPRHLLVDLYESIKKRPLKCSDERLSHQALESELDRLYKQQTAGGRSNTLPTRRFVPGSNAPSSTMSASSRRQFKQGIGRLNGQDTDPHETSIEFRNGVLVRKRIFEPRGRPTPKGRRGWRHVHAILHDLRLIMRPISAAEASAIPGSPDNARSAKVRQDMKNTVRIHHAFASASVNYQKRQFVFHLRLADQSEFLLQAKDEQDLTFWVDTINFAAACMSSPALPNAISNSSSKSRTLVGFQRPILPAAYTKLSYWEQLIDHEDRLQRLKTELDEHLTWAPQTKSANKRSKTEFIAKIADLRQDIERHKVYVDLMRKKSNSPEAIILSKHPQIASLTPSQEMLNQFKFAKSQRPSIAESTGQQVSDL